VVDEVLKPLQIRKLEEAPVTEPKLSEDQQRTIEMNRRKALEIFERVRRSIANNAETPRKVKRDDTRIKNKHVR
jgi:hypothetical protein